MFIDGFDYLFSVLSMLNNALLKSQEEGVAGLQADMKTIGLPQNIAGPIELPPTTRGYCEYA